MSISTSERYAWYFTTSDARAYTYRNDNAYSVALTSLSLWIGSGSGTINWQERSNIASLQSKISTDRQEAISNYLATSNWNWSTATAVYKAYSASATISYNGQTETSNTVTVNKNCGVADVGVRNTSNVTYTVTHDSAVPVRYTCAAGGSTPNATQGFGTYSSPSGATTFTFAGNLVIPAGATATVTVNMTSDNTSTNAFVYKDATGTPSVVEIQAGHPDITNITESVTKFKNNTYEVATKSVLSFTITAVNAVSYAVVDSRTNVTLYSGTSNSGSFTIPANWSGRYIYYAYGADPTDLDYSVHEDYNVYQYQPGSLTSFLSQRCLSDGTLDEEGTYVKCTATFTKATLTKDSSTITISTRLTAAVNGSSNYSNSGTLSVIIGAGTVLTNNNYTATYTLFDNITTQTVTDIVSANRYLLDFYKNGVAIGDRAADNAFKVGNAANPLSISINGSTLADYVIEQGSTTTDYTWRYRKWKSGRIELWCDNRAFTGVSGNNHIYAHLPTMVSGINYVQASFYVGGYPLGGYVSYSFYQRESSSASSYPNQFYTDTYLQLASGAASRAGACSYYVDGTWQ